VTSLPTPERRRLRRTSLKKRASLVVERGLQEQRTPCVILDYSHEGFRVRGPFRLNRGQLVEVILEEYSLNTVLCNVIWAGRPGSKQEGEAGLQATIQST
jgi:hypothetical protein